jgi:hypothetical protein
MKSTWEEISRANCSDRSEPHFNGDPCLLRYFKLDWSVRLLLNDCCPIPHLGTRIDSVQTKLNQVAGAKLTVDR